MTRFARAKGSKASNERVPENATSWNEMKQQLLDKNKEIEDSKKRKEAENKRVENYKAFLDDVEESKLSNVKWAEFPNKDKKKHKANKIESNNNTNDDDDDGPPEESSAKVAPDSVKVVKKKTKKKPLKIVVEEENKLVGNKPATQQNTDKESSLKKAKKRKLDTNKKQQVAVKKVKKAPEELTEAEKKKIEKKKQKRLKQVEKKKLKKAAQQENQAIATSTSDDNSNTSTAKPLNKKFEKNTKRPFSTSQGLKPNNSKMAKKKTGDKPERRKKVFEKMMINGAEVDIAYYDGFPIKKEDATRLMQLRRQMISKGLPRSEIQQTLKLERRKAEKALAREKKKVCFNCRKSGHNLSECPELGKAQLTESTTTGICFKCGSTEHTHFECKVVKGQTFKFAQCFICNEQGHIARQCPDNARGLYPKGGACKVCGDVTHLKKDCPKFQAQQQQLENNFSAEVFDGGNPDSIESEADKSGVKKAPPRPNKIIKF